MAVLPIQNGNGRKPNGKFAKGNKGGPGRGNSQDKRKVLLRGCLVASVTTEDIRAIVAALVEQAKAGNIHAIKEVLDRVIGKPMPIPPPEPEETTIHLSFANPDEPPPSPSGYSPDRNGSTATRNVQ